MSNDPLKAKQLVVLSGKGGTGKTSLVASFAHLSSLAEFGVDAVYVDADVDAANLSLVLKPTQIEVHEFWGGSLAEIETVKCNGCGKCVLVCRYDAIFPDEANKPAFWIDEIACDGCAACVYACPQDAIRMVPQQEGHWYVSSTPFGMLFHAELFAGKENSGKLVTLVKQQARLYAEDNQIPYVIVDGPPGIGCPVISACAGADLGLIVSEASVSGVHDMKRILGTLEHFRIPAVICINKGDIYPEGAKQIREFAALKGIEVMGDIPFDSNIPLAMLEGSSVTEVFPDSDSSKVIRQIWKKVCGLLN